MLCFSFMDTHYYRPQTKFAKVMFLHLSVILFTVGVSASVHAGIHTPRQQTPPPREADTPPQADTPPRKQTPPQEADTPLGSKHRSPCAVHATGMYTCYYYVYFILRQ